MSGARAATSTSVCAHPDAVGRRYGDHIGPERQAQLQAALDAWNAPGADHSGRAGPFAEEALTGADVSWLAHQVRLAEGAVPDLHLEGARLSGAHLEGAALAQAHLEGVDLWRAHLEHALLNGIWLDDASLFETHLEGATLFRASLLRARLLRAHLQGADLVEARLAGARLNQAHLEGVDFTRAHLEGAALQPDGADLPRIRRVTPAFPETLRPADLRDALLDDAVTLRDTIFCAPGSPDSPRLTDIHWGGASLALVDWSPFTARRALLGDERVARDWRRTPYQEPPGLQKEPRQVHAEARRAHNRRQARESLAVWAAAMRANRQLADALHRQGMRDEADHFAYRAQVARRGWLRRRRAWGRWLASGALDLLAGYGYKAARALVIYLLLIGAFAGLYLLATSGVFSPGPPHAEIRPLQWYDALALSAVSFHGGGFFQSLRPGGFVALLGVAEAAIGLFVEIGVLAAFAQRYLGAR